MLLLPLMLMPGTDTMAGLMAMDTTDTGLMAMDTMAGLMLMDTMAIPMPTVDTTMERGLLMLSPLLRLLHPLRLMLTPGTDTMAMASTDLMAMDTTDTGLMAMDTTTERG